MATIDVVQRTHAEHITQTDSRSMKVLITAINIGAWLADRFTCSEFPSGGATTVPTFEEAHMTKRDYHDWFYYNEQPFGD
jgi:hypothetical protein